jgi:transcriptional regulator with XRE-family HTH domain
VKDELIQLIEEIKLVESLTQYEIAARLGYDHTYLSQLLNGKKGISKKVLEKVKLTFPGVGYKVAALMQVATEMPEATTPIVDNVNPILAKNSNNSEKLDTLLLLMQQQLREQKAQSHKLSELEQQNIVTAAIQTQFQEYLVSVLKPDSDPEMTVVAMQRKAFEKLTRK